MRRLSKVWCSGSHDDLFSGWVSHLTKYSSTQPFQFSFDISEFFSALNTVSLSITIASGVDSFAFWSWLIFSRSDSTFDSFSFWGYRDSGISVTTGCKSVSLGFPSAEIGSKQSFGISDSLMYGFAGSSKGGGSIGVKFGSTPDTKKQLFYWWSCAT